MEKIEVNNITKEELLSAIAKVVSLQVKELKKVDETEKWYTIQEVSQHVKQSISNIRKLVEKREIPFTRFKGKNSTLLFKLSEIDDYLNNNYVKKQERKPATNSDNLIK